MLINSSFNMEHIKTLFLYIFINFIFYTNVSGHNHTKYVYLTNMTGIIRFPLNSTSDNQLGPKEVLHVNMDALIRSLTIDESNNRMFWSDLRNNDIVQSDVRAQSQQKIFSYAIGYAEGLTIDWSSDNLYWTDSLMKLVEVSTSSGAHRKVLFGLTNGDEPRAIFADPRDGYLFWTDWGKSPKIERSTLAGTVRQTIVRTNIKWPNDLSIDYSSDRIFWIDAYYDHIASANFDGSNVIIETVLKMGEILIHPYSFVYYPEQNISYFTDWYNDSLHAISPLSPNNSATLVYKNSPRVKSIGQVRILGAEKPENVSRPCPSNECSHLCLKSGRNVSVCDCPTGMISINGSQCASQPKEYELFFIDKQVENVNHLVKYKSQHGFTVKPLNIPSNERMRGLNAIDFNSGTNRVYWDDYQNGKLYRMKVDGTDFRVIRSDIKTFAIEINELSNTIYYHDTVSRSLVMMSLDGQYKRVVKENIRLVKDIAIHEQMGYIYYVDSGRGYIGRLDLNEENEIEYHGSTRSVDVTGLAVDEIENRVYWCDRNNYKIMSSDLDFRDLKVIVQQTFFIGLRFWIVRNRGFVVEPNSVDIIGDKIYWTDQHRRAIFESEKRFGGDIKYLTGGLSEPRDIHAYRAEMKTEYVKVYKFAVARSTVRRQYAWCAAREGLCSNLYSRVSTVPRCPPGFRQTNYAQRCMNCSETLGANFVCPCNDWASCAQRTYSDVYGCHTTIPYMAFKVRECTKEIRAGFCPFSTSCPSNSQTCSADHDCSTNMKCCKTSCGSRCVSPLANSDHPCKIGTSGCSHFCLAKKESYTCGCPNNLAIDFFGKDCVVDRCQANRCTNGECFSLKDRTTLCKCANKYWIGRSCSINLRNDLVVARFRKSKNTNIHLDELKQRLAFDYTDYCVSGSCSYLEESVRTRRRRMTPSAGFSFKSEDIFIDSFDNVQDIITVTFIVTKPKDQYNLTSGHLTVDSLLAGINYFGTSLARVLNVEYLSAEKVGTGEKEDKKKLSGGAIAGIIIVVIVLIVASLALLFWYYRQKSRSSQPQNVSTLETERPVHYQFENELYDDVNKSAVKLPEVPVDNNENNYTDPNGATAVMASEVENKEVPKEWVTFDNKDEKPPITDFVEAELYSDPYHIDSPPPAYSSLNEYEKT